MCVAAVCSVLCAVCCVLCAVCVAAVCSVLCAVCSVLCAVGCVLCACVPLLTETSLSISSSFLPPSFLRPSSVLPQVVIHAGVPCSLLQGIKKDSVFLLWSDRLADLLDEYELVGVAFSEYVSVQVSLQAYRVLHPSLP